MTYPPYGGQPPMQPPPGQQQPYSAPPSGSAGKAIAMAACGFGVLAALLALVVGGWRAYRQFSVFGDSLQGAVGVATVVAGIVIAVGVVLLGGRKGAGRILMPVGAVLALAATLFSIGLVVVAVPAVVGAVLALLAGPWCQTRPPAYAQGSPQPQGYTQAPGYPQPPGGYGPPPQQQQPPGGYGPPPQQRW